MLGAYNMTCITVIRLKPFIEPLACAASDSLGPIQVGNIMNCVVSGQDQDGLQHYTTGRESFQTADIGLKYKYFMLAEAVNVYF